MCPTSAAICYNVIMYVCHVCLLLCMFIIKLLCVFYYVIMCYNVIVLTMGRMDENHPELNSDEMESDNVKLSHLSTWRRMVQISKEGFVFIKSYRTSLTYFTHFN